MKEAKIVFYQVSTTDDVLYKDKVHEVMSFASRCFDENLPCP